MRRVRIFALIVYVLAGICVVGMFAGSLFGPYTARFAELLSLVWVRIALAVCLAIVCAQLIAVVVALIIDRPEPTCVRLEGNSDIEVSVDALTSVARVAATDPDILVEDIRARVVGRDKSEVQIHVDAIALVEHGLEGLARQVQQRVQEACERTLGTTGVSVSVRFLPSKTVTVTKEVAGE